MAQLQATYAPPRSTSRPDNSIKLGRWDPVTGTVVYTDGGQAQSAFRVVKAEPKPVEPAPKPEPRIVKPKAEKRKRTRKPRAPRPLQEPKPRQNERTQPTIEQVRQALSLYTKGRRLRDVSKAVGLGYHLTGDILAGAGVLREPGGQAKVTVEQANEIRNATGKQRVIAEKYGITREEVNRIKRGRVMREGAGKAPEDAPRTLERDLLRATLLTEFAPILHRCGIPGWACYRRQRVSFGPVLVEVVARYVYGRYLVKPTLCEGMTLGGAIDLTVHAIVAARRRTV